MRINLSHTIKQTHDVELPINMNIELAASHQIVGMFGPSGAGKTSMLKIIAGLIPNAQCSLQMEWVHSNGVDYGKQGNQEHTALSTQAYEYINTQGRQNPCVYIGSDSPLFSHITVHENLSLVVRHSNSRKTNSITLDHVVDLCNVESLLPQYPSQLSAGQTQRICFARALLSGKKILLLDEAFSALDWAIRNAMHLVLRKLVLQEGYRAIMVSHSLQELSLCVSHVLGVENGLLVHSLPVEDALSHYNESATNTQNDHYFSLIKAAYSHTDEQDPSLQVWLIEAASSSQKQRKVFVKANNRVLARNSHAMDSMLVPQVNEERSFVLNANQLSVSRHENNLTSMVNCFAVDIENIVQNDTGVLLIGRCGQHSLRAAITIKSFLSLKITTGERVYFVCKAL